MRFRDVYLLLASLVTALVTAFPHAAGRSLSTVIPLPFGDFVHTADMRNGPDFAVPIGDHTETSHLADGPDTFLLGASHDTDGTASDWTGITTSKNEVVGTENSVLESGK